MSNVQTPPVFLKVASVPASAVGVSIVIPSHNTSRFIVAAIRSALQQTYSAIEVIVVDDGSTDDSLGQILTVEDERLTCVVQPNRGLSAARNTGIRLARGAYIGFLDSDDLWSPLKVVHHLAIMERDAQIGVTFSHSAYIDEDGYATGEHLTTRYQRPNVWQLIARNHVGNGSTPIVRRECFAANGFDEDLSACADWEFWVRLASAGWTFQLIPKALTGYRVRNGSMTVGGASDDFLADGLEAIQRFGNVVPFSSSRAGDGARAQLYRVASRKALHNGDVDLSRRLLRQAVMWSPITIVRERRALALILFHVVVRILPRHVQLLVLRLAHAVRRVFANRFGGVSTPHEFLPSR